MSDKVTEQLANEVVVWLSGIRETAQEHAPDIAQQIVQWGIAYNLLWLAASLAVMVCSIVAVVKLVKYGKTKNDSYSAEPWYFVSMIPGLVGLGAAAMVTNFLSYLVKVLVAPKLYVLQYLASLV